MTGDLPRRRIITSTTGVLLAGGVVSAGRPVIVGGQNSVPDDSDALYEELAATTETTLEAVRRLHSILESVGEAVENGDWESGRERLRESGYNEIGEEFVAAQGRTEELGEAADDSELRAIVGEYITLMTEIVDRIEERRELIEEAIMSGYDGREEEAERHVDRVAEFETQTEEMIVEAGEKLQELHEHLENLVEEVREGDSGSSQAVAGDQPRRGFLTNDPNAMRAPDSLLNDPVTLTMTGFVLSVVGILYQMVSS